MQALLQGVLLKAEKPGQSDKQAGRYQPGQTKRRRLKSNRRDRKTIAVLKNKDDIRKLIGELKIDEWKSVREIPAEEKAAYRCLLYQAETKKLNEDSKAAW